MQGEQVRADRFTATLARHLQHHGGATTAAASAAARVAAAGLSFQRASLPGDCKAAITSAIEDAFKGENHFVNAKFAKAIEDAVADALMRLSDHVEAVEEDEHATAVAAAAATTAAAAAAAAHAARVAYADTHTLPRPAAAAAASHAPTPAPPSDPVAIAVKGVAYATKVALQIVASDPNPRTVRPSFDLGGKQRCRPAAAKLVSMRRETSYLYFDDGRHDNLVFPRARSSTKAAARFARGMKRAAVAVTTAAASTTAVPTACTHAAAVGAGARTPAAGVAVDADAAATTSAAHVHTVQPRVSRGIFVRHHQGTVRELPISDGERVADLRKCLSQDPQFGGDWFLRCEGKVLANDMELSELNAEVEVVQCMRGLGGGKVRAPPMFVPCACLCLR